MTDQQLTPPSPKIPNQLQDGAELWAREAGGGIASGLSLIRLDANESLVIPFTTSMLRVNLHFLDSAALRGYIHCTGLSAKCLPCRIGRHAEVRDLWPVYDPVAQCVGLLPISPNLRPQALRPALAPLIRQLQAPNTPRLILSIRRLDNVHFAVGSSTLPEDAEDGASHIAAFLEQLRAGTVDLGAVYPRLSSEELAAIPEIGNAMRLKGIKP